MRDGIGDRPALGGCVQATRSTANHANVFEGEEVNYSNNSNNNNSKKKKKKKENNRMNPQTIFFSILLSSSPSFSPCSLSSPTVAPISKVSHSLLMSIRLGPVCLLIVSVCVSVPVLFRLKQG